MSRILFLSGWFPYPPDNGSKLRIYNLLHGLAQQHALSLLVLTDQPAANLDTSGLSMCRNVAVLSRKTFDPNSLRARLGFLSLTPRSAIDTFSQHMERLIEQSVSSGHYDLVIASQTMMAEYGPMLRGLPALFEESEISVPYEQFTRAASLRRRFRSGLTWAKYRRHTARLLRYFRACTVVSEHEKQLLKMCAPDYTAVEVIPNCVHLAEYDSFQEQARPNTLIFTGSFRYGPNYDAMVWFLSQVYPQIQTQAPDVQLTITGDRANRVLPAADHVRLTGFVPNVRSLIASSWASIAPLRKGGGTRVKILEAMALRTPVVATSKGAEGLEAHHDMHLLIADTPEDFACSVVRLFREPGLRDRLVDNAYQLVREKYDWAAVMPRFLKLVEYVAHG